MTIDWARSGLAGGSRIAERRRMSAHRAAPRAASDRYRQAVVLGGGMAGMLAARVLADTFEQVTIVERHDYHLADTPASQRQDDQYVTLPPLTQTLADPAQAQLEGLFPGLCADLVGDAAAIGRPEHHLAQRLNSLDGVVMMDGCDAVGLASDRERCVGGQVLPRSRSAAARTIPADLLVDAMGAGSRLSLWLTELWGTRIPIERYEVLLPADARDAGETAGAAISHTKAACLRRRFDRAERLPTGLIALGSSLCCLDPRSGRGVMVAALHARLLQQLLAEDAAEGSAGRSRLVPSGYFDAVIRVPSWLSPDTVMTPARDGVYPWP
jgi:hypothetical protein